MVGIMDKIVISRERYQQDLERGYAILKWQPRGSRTKRDLFTGDMVTVRPSPIDVFQCMDCQFSATNLELMQKHLEKDNHPWGYADGNTPYGPLYLITLEGCGETQNQGDSK